MLGLGRQRGAAGFGFIRLRCGRRHGATGYRCGSLRCQIRIQCGRRRGSRLGGRCHRGKGRQRLAEGLFYRGLFGCDLGRGRGLGLRYRGGLDRDCGGCDRFYAGRDRHRFGDGVAPIECRVISGLRDGRGPGLLGDCRIDPGSKYRQGITLNGAGARLRGCRQLNGLDLLSGACVDPGDFRAASCDTLKVCLRATVIVHGDICDVGRLVDDCVIIFTIHEMTAVVALAHVTHPHEIVTARANVEVDIDIVAKVESDAHSVVRRTIFRSHKSLGRQRCPSGIATTVTPTDPGRGPAITRDPDPA